MKVRFNRIMLDNELYHLDSVDFIRPLRIDPGLEGIRKDHESDAGDFDLKQYVEITPKGRKYLALLDQFPLPATSGSGDW